MMAFVSQIALGLVAILVVAQPTAGGNSTSTSTSKVLKLNIFEKIVLQHGSLSSSTYTFAVPALTPPVTTIVISLTSDRGILTLSVDNAAWGSPNITTSRNPGITVPVNPNDQFTINASINHAGPTGYNPSTAVDAQLVVTAYQATAPIPGGCGIVSQFVVDDPTMVMRQSDVYTVDIQLGASDLAPKYSLAQRNIKSGLTTCDIADDPGDNIPSALEYHLYSHYMNSCGSGFKKVFDDAALQLAVNRMNSLNDVLTYGHLEQTAPIEPEKPILFSLDIVPGQGVVYNVVVTDTEAYTIAKESDPTVDKKQFQSAYAPYATYHCSRTYRANCSAVPGTGPWCNLLSECMWDDEANACLDNPNFNSCDDLVDWQIMVFEIIIGFCGLAISILGHKYFRVEIGLLGFLFFGALGYILSTSLGSLEEKSRLILSGATGIGGGLLLLYYWFLSRGSAIVLVFVGMCFGIFIANFLFATPLGDFDIWRNSFNYWMAYACMVFIWPILMLLKDRVGNIAATSVIGSYCLLFAIDFFVASSFDDILINTFKRATVPSFSRDYSGDYFSTAFNGCSNVTLNTIMLVAWVVTSMICFAIQWFVFGGRSTPVPTSDRTRGYYCKGLFCGDYGNRYEPIRKRKVIRRRGRDPDLESRFDRPLAQVSGRDFNGHRHLDERRRSIDSGSGRISADISRAPVYEDEPDVPMLTADIVEATRGDTRDVVSTGGRKDRPAQKKKRPKSRTATTQRAGLANGLFDSDDDDEPLLRN